jgi:methionyl-tRNA formyltransferase
MLIFFGTSHYSAQFLDLVTKNGLKIDLVVSSPPKLTGRKQVLTENPVILLAKERKISFATDLKEVPTAQLGLMLDFNRIIPSSIIDRFEKGIINIHFSKLPAYRGPAPVQATILNDKKEAGITYFLITEKLDEGPVLIQMAFPLSGTETTGELYEKMTQKAAQEAPKVIVNYLDNKVIPKPQKGSFSYTKKLTAKEAKIDWRGSAAEIDRLIRAVSPEPGAWTLVKIKGRQLRLKIRQAHLENDQIVLDTVQLEGKRPVSFKQFMTGYPKAEILRD